MPADALIQSPLGKETSYVTHYTPSLLYPISRKMARDELGLSEPLPFDGVDIWNGYELSWLNLKGKPEVALAEFIIPAGTPSIVESKSFKLYLNSFNQSRFESHREVQKVLEKDLSKGFDAPIVVKLGKVETLRNPMIDLSSYQCLDDLDIEIDQYDLNPSILQITDTHSSEKLFSHLLKSNCLVTGQPDWGTLFIHYEGPQIDHESLLKYIISFRNHQGFAEQCAERIYVDILRCCKPLKLSVYARYTRRGGLDINPFRSNFETDPPNVRLSRQ